jgi:EmrB/QacA subfamily drug resistance transporter
MNNKSPLIDNFDSAIPIIVAMVLFMEFLDSSILNTAIPTIARQFMVNPIILKFSVATYYIGLAVFIPISGYCTDRFGTKAVFVISILFFILFSYLCTIAHSTAELSVYRFFQGIGGALMNPASRIILIRITPPQKLLKVQAFVFSTALTGMLCGPIIGGIIINYFAWEWIFYINIPIGILSIYLGFKHVEQVKAKIIPKFDFLGFIIIATSLCFISIGTEFIGHFDIIPFNKVIIMLFLGILLFLYLIYHCKRSKKPIFNFKLFEIKTFRIGFILNLSIYIITTAIPFMLPLLFQECFKLSPMQSGILIVPLVAAFVIGRRQINRLISRLGFRDTLIIGMLLQIIGLLIFANYNANTSIIFIIITEFMFGLASVTLISATGALNYVDVPKIKVSQVTTIDITSRQFTSSMSIGICSLALIFFAKFFHLDLFASNAKVFNYTFYLLALISSIGLISVFRLNKNDGHLALSEESH